MPRPTNIAVALALALAIVLVVAAPAATQDDPNLDQTISTEQPIAADDAVIDAGHVDLGPRFVDETWTLLVHDDSTTPSAWRHLDRTVLRLTDAALVTVPDDPAYGFVGAPPGASVHVVSQTQQPDVVWLGWNTQDPGVMERIDRGATMTLLGVDGPGRVTTYLQSGNFGAPQVLWDSTVAERQPVWVDVNTHTHANWVFTEPGIYLMRVEVAADLVSGDRVVDVRDLRFAVGDATATEEALDAEYSGTVASEPSSGATTRRPSSGTAGDQRAGSDSAGAGFAVALVVSSVALVMAAVVLILRSRGAKRRVQRERERERTGPTSVGGTTGGGR